MMNVMVFVIDKSAEPEDSDNDDGTQYWSYIMAGNIYAIWTMLVTSIAIVVELILGLVNIAAFKYCTVCNFRMVMGILVR